MGAHKAPVHSKKNERSRGGVSPHTVVCLCVSSSCGALYTIHVVRLVCNDTHLTNNIHLTNIMNERCFFHFFWGLSTTRGTRRIRGAAAAAGRTPS
jgi:hypothetical protein